LWTGAGLDAIETREITVQRSFADFDEFWAITSLAAAIGSLVAAMPTADVERLKARVRERLPPDAAGHITLYLIRVAGHSRSTRPGQPEYHLRRLVCDVDGAPSLTHAPWTRSDGSQGPLRGELE